VIVCPRCGKENQDHYKFCLGCGAELPRDAAHAPKSFTAATPPAVGGTGSAPMMGGPAPFGGPAPIAAPAPFGGPAPMGGPAPFGGPAPIAAPAPFGGPAPMGGPAPFGGPAPMGGPAPFGGAAPVAAPAPMGFGGPAPVPMGGPGPFGGPATMPAPAAAPAAAPAGDTVQCGNCGTVNNKNFRFCGTCGSVLGGSAPQMAAPVAPAPAATRRGSLVLIRPDGSEGETVPMSDTTLVGREAGGVFASDSYLSPQHATLSFHGGTVLVQDEGSLNGVYRRIAADEPTEIEDGAMFRIGQEIIRFERLRAQPERDGVETMGSPSEGIAGRICLMIGRETTGNCFPVPSAGLHLGRERGDLLFPEDGYVSGLHCRLHEEGGKLWLTDVGSSNGTFVRLNRPTAVPAGTLLLMGQQLFRIEF